jgi:hypothetical protein
MPGLAKALELAALFRIGAIALLFRAAGACALPKKTAVISNMPIEILDRGRNFMLRILLSYY